MKRSRNKRNKRGKKTALPVLLFAVGLAAGFLISLLFKVHVSPGPLKYYKAERRHTVSPKAALIAHPLVVPPIARAAHPKVAIVLDDFGYSYRNVNAIFDIKQPVTFSILPDHPYSKKIAERIYEKSYEAILHLPLEAIESEMDITPEAGTIKVGMKESEILDRLTKALADVPHVKGVSNHQGSKATEYGPIMRIIFTELKKRHLFFLDSLVTNKSACRSAARQAGIGFGRRNVFLDNEGDFEYIQGQMEQLIRKAKKTGSAIGIGHDRPSTVFALSKLMPEASKEGVEFVFLSNIIKGVPKDDNPGD